MNVNDVVKEGSKFMKLDAGQSVMVRFKNEFEKSEGKHNGRKFTSYQCPCFIRENGETLEKVWSGSSSFYDKCLKIANEYSMAFEDCNFKIEKQNIDGKTNWDIQIMNVENNAG